MAATVIVDKPAPSTADTMELAKDRDLKQKIRVKRDEIDWSKSLLKRKKAELDNLLEELVSDQSMPLFDGNGQAKPAAPDDSWRKTPIGESLAGISAGIIEKLAEAEIKTLGQLADYSKDGATLTGIKGIGDKTAEKIEAALEVWWKEHPQAKAAAVVTEVAQGTEMPEDEEE